MAVGADGPLECTLARRPGRAPGAPGRRALAGRGHGLGRDVDADDLRAAARRPEEQAIERARETAADEGVDVRFEVADAAALRFGDGEFDGVVSAFGVMFGPHERIARQLARVCRPGGRLGLTLMPPGSRAAELWSLLGAFGAEVVEHPARFAERVDALLGGAFELEIRRVESALEEQHSPEESWEMLRRSLGPLRRLLERLDEPKTEELRREFVAVGHRFADEPRSYVLVLGRRR
ncbi:MAG: class I SAM-dependent methyltransferase [Thermoleophilia bacterium]|nr:class I SAM-dependent methyltransferase [Thermoleophilia bacterium]